MLTCRRISGRFLKVIKSSGLRYTVDQCHGEADYRKNSFMRQVIAAENVETVVLYLFEKYLTNAEKCERKQ